MRAPDRRRVDVGPLPFGVVFSSSAPAPVPAGPAIVLVHGIGVSHRYLKRLHEVLAETREVVSV
ncbi:MAG TPA: alpha/beta hydrolase, partial [Agromyces sp.]